MSKRTKTSSGVALSLTLSGERITADRFLKGVASFFGIVTEVSEAVTGHRGGIEWIVSARAGSVVVDFKPVPVKADPLVVSETVRAIRDGLDLIERKPERPRYWSDAALKRAKELAGVTEPARQGLTQVSIDANAGGRKVTLRTKEHVDTLIGTELRALGSIEGRLRTVTEGGGLHFIVQDEVTHNEIRCYIKDEDVEKILGAFRKRVVVYGEICYRRDKQPASITVERFRVLRDRGDLPTPDEVRGILA
jgi:hypothetical protein